MDFNTQNELISSMKLSNQFPPNAKFIINTSVADTPSQKVIRRSFSSSKERNLHNSINSSQDYFYNDPKSLPIFRKEDRLTVKSQKPYQQDRQIKSEFESSQAQSYHHSKANKCQDSRILKEKNSFEQQMMQPLSTKRDNSSLPTKDLANLNKPKDISQQCNLITVPLENSLNTSGMSQSFMNNFNLVQSLPILYDITNSKTKIGELGTKLAGQQDQMNQCECFNEIKRLNILVSEMSQKQLQQSQENDKLHQDNQFLLRELESLTQQLSFVKEVDSQQLHVGNKENQQLDSHILKKSCLKTRPDSLQTDKIIKRIVNKNKELKRQNAEMEQLLKKLLLRNEISRQLNSHEHHQQVLLNSSKQNHQHKYSNIDILLESGNSSQQGTINMRQARSQFLQNSSIPHDINTQDAVYSPENHNFQYDHNPSFQEQENQHDLNINHILQKSHELYDLDNFNSN